MQPSGTVCSSSATAATASNHLGCATPPCVRNQPRRRSLTPAFGIVRTIPIRPSRSPCSATTTAATCTISSTAVPGITRGEAAGRRDRASDAASLSARYRATSRDTQLWEIP